MRNSNGEIIRIAGKTIDTPPVRWEFILGPESANMTQTALDGENNKYYYDGLYLNHDIGPDGMHNFKIAFTDHNGSEPLGSLFQKDAHHFDVDFGSSTPEFSVERSDDTPASFQTESAEPRIHFTAVIQEGKRNVNVRSSPPSGNVVTTVDGGRAFPVHEIREMSDPIYLLTERTELQLVDDVGTITKAANYKLESPSNAGAFYFA